MNEQENREKVIKGLECCISGNPAICKRVGCPYAEEHDGIGDTCIDHLMADAIALLKAQEPVKPIMHYVPDGKRSSAAWQCGNCLIDIGYGANYCYNCGREVKWE